MHRRRFACVVIVAMLCCRQVSADDPKEANRHTMLRSRKWWEAKFAAHGAEVNHEMLWAMQYKNHRCGASGHACFDHCAVVKCSPR